MKEIIEDTEGLSKEERNKREFISWPQFDQMTSKIAYWCRNIQREFSKWSDVEIGAVYGIPRGGLPIATMLSHKLNLPLLI